MQTATVKPSVGHAHVGDHVCQPYGSDEEFLQHLVDLTTDALDRRHKVLIFTEVLPAPQVAEHLGQRIPGWAQATQRDQFTVRSCAQTYLADGAFLPDRRLADLTAEASEAEAEGYACLQVITDMSWALRAQPGIELVYSYEAGLTPLCTEWRLTVACLYDLRQLSRHAFYRAYSAHPNTATRGPRTAEPHPRALSQPVPA